jgi:quercetin dioxygenase-like cupin family protein
MIGDRHQRHSGHAGGTELLGRQLGDGDVLFIPAGAIHSAKNVGSATGAELATYVVDKGKPLVELVE